METKIYLSYKKIVMISPRDFVYHKKTKIMDEVKEVINTNYIRFGVMLVNLYKIKGILQDKK